MPHPLRSFVVAGSLLALATGAAACSSGGSDAAPTTTAAKPTATTEPKATTTTADATSTTAAGGETTTTAQVVDPATGKVDCTALLQEYTVVFDPDDLSTTVAFFRRYEPSMPDDVAAASERIAVAYEKAGDLGHMDMGSVDLTADAQTFSDWTNDGCPAG
ncbi:MAG: hypothetical protein ACTHN0_17700 [Aquihabitans sp.]